LWTTEERTDGSIMGIICVSRVYDSLKYRNVAKQTNPFKVDNLITNRYLEILEASRIRLNTHVGIENNK
jgi:hypothetical protein